MHGEPKVKWQWENDGGEWEDYGKDVSAKLEDIYLKRSGSVYTHKVTPKKGNPQTYNIDVRQKWQSKSPKI